MARPGSRSRSPIKKSRPIRKGLVRRSRRSPTTLDHGGGSRPRSRSPSTSGRRRRSQPRRTWHRRETLLVVDNCEHVIEDVGRAARFAPRAMPSAASAGDEPGVAGDRRRAHLEGAFACDRRRLGRRAALRESPRPRPVRSSHSTTSRWRSSATSSSGSTAYPWPSSLPPVALAVDLASSAIVSTIGSGSLRAAERHRANGKRPSKPRCSGRTTC